MQVFVLFTTQPRSSMILSHGKIFTDAIRRGQQQIILKTFEWATWKQWKGKSNLKPF